MKLEGKRKEREELLEWGKKNEEPRQCFLTKRKL